MAATVISVSSTTDLDPAALAVVGERWLHTVAVDGEIVKVAVRRSGMGYSMDIENASSPEIAEAALAAVASNPTGS